MKTIRLLSLSLALVLVGVLSVEAQNAASQARGTAHGSYDFNAHRLYTHQHHARDYAGIVYQQSQLKEGLPPAETQEYVESIKQSITAANKALTKLEVAHPKDAAVKASVEKIRKLHKSALAHCEMCDGECKKATGASQAVIGTCCESMAKDLDAAKSETEQLMKHLKIEKLHPLKAAVAPPAAPAKAD